MGEKDSAKTADEVMVTAIQITPAPWVEVHCHGGMEAIRWLMEILVAQGCQSCSWGDLERATTSDPWKTAAELEMVQATTIRTAAILLNQYHGAFVKTLSEIQLAFLKDNLIEGTRLLEALARYAEIGRHFTAPWRVAVIGPPNVGKSSLVNALAGFQRSIVAPTPGTTRDLVSTMIAADGWPVELIDTAGMRDEPETLEAQGITLSLQAAAESNLCLWILDASEPAIWPEPDLGKNSNLEFVVNKTDLPAVWDILEAAATPVSARTSAGLAELVDALARRLVPNPPPPGAAVPFTSALADQVEEALALARAGRIEELKQNLTALANEPR
jgi:tRNA modification GTPase